MRPDDVPHAEMFKTPRFRRILGARRLDKRADALAPQYLQSGEWYDVADLLGAAAAPAAASELAGEREIIAAFQREHLDSVSVTARRRTPVRSRMLNSLLTGKIVAALAATALGATGAATAAYADALPDSVQDIAHHLIAAPPAHSHASDSGRAHGHQFGAASPSPTVNPSPSTSESAAPSGPALPSDSVSPSVSPSASASPSAGGSLDPAAVGLCTAWSNAVDHNRQDQVGFKSKLAGIAGGDASMSDDDITSFCATVQKSHDSTDTDEADDQASVSPSASPAPSATADEHGHNGDNHGKSGNGNGGHGNDDAPGHH
jgi:hypothetical protein